MSVDKGKWGPRDDETTLMGAIGSECTNSLTSVNQLVTEAKKITPLQLILHKDPGTSPTHDCETEL